MSNTTQPAASGGIGFLGLLTIVFITLKLTGVISWSWWWVTAPLWIPVGVVAVVVILVAVIGVLVNRRVQR